jgi:L-alanine-DL-glutamate epimerase-like enolase superfamily enzyme
MMTSFSPRIAGNEEEFMKITSVEIFDVENGGSKQKSTWHPVLVRINTDEGISGVGEAGLAYGVGHSAGAAMVKNLAETFLIDADPMKTEKIWDDMFKMSFWAKGGGTIVFSGMSAIDIALWDIKGKVFGVPVHQLLGGKTNPSIRTYASQIQFGWEGEYKMATEPEHYAEAALKAVEEGFDCVKVDPIMIDQNGNRDYELTGILTKQKLNLFYNRLKAVREAVGDHVDIIIELHSLSSATSAVQLGRLFEEFGCMYYEEPVHYLNPDLQVKVARNVKIPMAAGERLYTRWGYRPYFEKQALDVIQPDLALVGGITEGKKICDYAHVYDISVQIHVCGAPVSTAAALQLEAVIPNFIIHEHHVRALQERNRNLCVPDYQPKNGKFEVPDVPGLGIELDDKALSDFPKMVID